jgi:outer membrane biosynthesis protein TonB
MTDDGNGRNGSGSFDPAQAVRSAAAAAAVGAAVGALRAFTARRSETEAPPEQDERTIETDEELLDEQGLDEPNEPEETEPDEEPETPEASTEPEPEQEPGPEQEPEPEPEPRPRQQRQEEPKAEPAPPGQLFELSERARDAVRQLRGVEAESISGLARTPNGWAVTLEVVEVHRIPESTDVLASYEVELAEDGGLVRFERTRRYHRTQESDGA